MKQDPFEKLRELFPRTAKEPAGVEQRRGTLFAIAFSVAVAFVLWFTVSMRETYTLTVESPLHVVSTPDGLALAELPPPTVRVQLQGVGWDLLQLSRRPPTISVVADGPDVDLQSAAAEAANLPAGVLVQSVQPQHLDLSLDSRVERRMPIALAGRIEVAPTFGRLGDPVLTPDSVVITGARSLLDRFEAWPTAPLMLDNLRRSVTSFVALSDTLAGLVSTSVERIQVFVEIAQMTEGSRRLAIRPMNVPANVLDVRLIPATVRVSYQVPADGDDYDLAAGSEEFYAFVDYADIANDSTAGTVPVSVHLPDGLMIQDVQLEKNRVEYYTVRE